jgi:predicted regulator of Ras-like GTPase activity (Roadblock/LC7/MglB family)
LELERVLTKLRYDESVSGYALITNDGVPFLSFSLPDETIPTIQESLRIHADELRFMNVMTGAGTVILARIDAYWVLAVLFVTSENLGSALQKTKNVIELLTKVDLPPPPATAVSEPISIPDTIESVLVEDSISETPITTEVMEPSEVPERELEVRHGCIILRGKSFPDAQRDDSELYISLTDQFANVGVDVLLMVDEKRTAFKIAESLDRRIEQIIEVLQWCVTNHVIDLECPEEEAPGQKEIVELPLFEGDIKKVKKQHRAVLELCDGELSLHEIAEQLGIPYFDALQSTIKYKGKSLRFVRRTVEAS